jgi:hypothetical protein
MSEPDPGQLSTISSVSELRSAIVRHVTAGAVTTGAAIAATLVARAASDRAVLLDVRPADHVLRNRSVYTPDLFHPGEIGHSAWADAAVAGLRRAVELVDAAIHPSQPSPALSFGPG